MTEQNDRPSEGRTPDERSGALPADSGAERTAAATAFVDSGRNRSIARWGIALIVVGLVVGLIAAGLYLLGGKSAPEAYGYVGRDSALVLELRPDLPGDQRQKLGALLARFPGFADQANLEDKIDEALHRLIGEASGGSVDYRTQVKPWLDGPIVVAMPEIPDEDADAASRGVAVFTVRDETSCYEGMDVEVQRTERHRDAELQIAERDGHTVACAKLGQLVLIGDVESVKGALDTEASGNDITKTDGFNAALAAFDGDHVGFAYVDLRRAAEGSGTRPGGPDFGDLPQGRIPDWVAMVLRFDDDALVLDFVSPDPTVADADGSSPAPSPVRTIPPDKVSTLAPRLPASTVAVFEGRGIGAMILTMIDTLREDPDSAAQIREFEQGALLFGGLDGLVGWMDDAALVLTHDGVDVAGGLVFQPTDAGVAQSRLDQLKSLLILAGGSAGVSVDDVAHGDATITVIDLGDLGDLLGLLAGESPLPIDPDESLRIAYTVHDGIVVFGVDPTFVEAVLDTAAGSSLADQPAYQRSIDLAGATNGGQFFLDIRGVVAAIEGTLDGAEADRFRSDIRPYIDPLDGAAFSAGRDGDLIRGRFVVSLR